MTQPYHGRAEADLTNLGLPYRTVSNERNNCDKYAAGIATLEPGQYKPRLSANPERAGRSLSRRRSPKKVLSHHEIAEARAINMHRTTGNMQTTTNAIPSSAITSQFAKHEDSYDDDKRLESLSNRITNLKIQYKGILSSQTGSEAPNLSLYSSNFTPHEAIASRPHQRMEPEMDATPLSLSLGNPAASSFLSPNRNISLTAASSYENSYDQGYLMRNVEGSYSSLPFSANLSPSPSSIVASQSSLETISASRSLSHPTTSTGKPLSSKADSGASYLLARPASHKAQLQSTQTQVSSTLSTPNHTHKYLSLSSTSPVNIDATANSLDLADLIGPESARSSFPYSEHNYDSQVQLKAANATAHLGNGRYDKHYLKPETNDLNQVINGSGPPSIDSYLPTSSIGTNSGSAENLFASGPIGPGYTSTHYSPYFKETVEDLGPEEYRWFYKTESDKKWVPFIGYDSLRIEWKFRDLLHNGLTTISVNPSYLETTTDNGLSEGASSDGDERPFELGEEGTVTVRGGLYEVDVKHRRGQSIYWKGEVFVVCRGTWFYEGAWTPLEESLAEKLEAEHLLHFRGHPLNVPGLSDAQKQVVHRLAVPEGSVEWFSASEVYMSLDATHARLMRSVGKKLGFQKTGYKVHRGYSLDASASDKPPDITHLVFVIHGIGQKMDTGRIIKNCTSLRDNVNSLKQRYLRELNQKGEASPSTTVEFFPVEWRSSLTLDGGLIDSITPHKILNIRQMLNASFMDIMYYNSPLYREEVGGAVAVGSLYHNNSLSREKIVTVLSSELNRLYSLFTDRNPYFEANGGQVSVVSHSLGCVITYDIVTGWSPTPQLSTSFLQAMSGVLGNQQQSQGSEGAISNSGQLQSALQRLLHDQLTQAEQPNLNFRISNLFCLGSPLAVFLALRWRKGAGAPPMLTKGRFQRILNIFHPSDPVAYRLEPLLCRAYGSVAPVQLHCHSTSEKLPYDQMPLEPVLVTKDQEQGEAGTTTSPTTSQPTTPVRAGGTSSWNLWGLMKGGKKSDPSQQQTPSQTDPQLNIGSPWTNSPSSGGTPSAGGGASMGPTTITLDDSGQQLSESRRIDFVLREGSMESSYISALTSHTSYWSNSDVAHFLLTTLYPHLQTCTGSGATGAAGASSSSASNGAVGATGST